MGLNRDEIPLTLDPEPPESVLVKNLIKKPWAYNPKIVGFIYGTPIKAQGFLIRFLHYPGSPKP